VASALRYLAKQVMSGCYPETRSAGAEAVRGHLTGARGIGEPMILRFLADVPGVNKNTVTEHLAILKASGDYVRIIETVVTAMCRR
jgi:hypothetical protein